MLFWRDNVDNMQHFFMFEQQPKIRNPDEYKKLNFLFPMQHIIFHVVN